MKPTEQKLLSLLSNKDVTFFIPPFQRNYEWTYDQCEVFWNDIIEVTKQNIPKKTVEHFFGAITYYQVTTAFGEPDILILIDGQQRITTTMLFLMALRDVIKDGKAQKNIENKYLKNENSTGDDDEYKIKLKQVESDWAAYKKIVLSKPLTDREKDASVYKNYQYFRHRLVELSCDDPERLLLIQNGLAEFSIITIELQPQQNSWENPQEIFESMNSIGKPLSLADLVRNYLLLGCDDKRQNELYKNYWLPMEETLPQKLSSFIRDYMQTWNAKSYPIASEAHHKELYREFKKTFGYSNQEVVLSRLKEYSTIYSHIVLGTNSGNEKVDGHLQDFRTLQITTSYSFLLAILWAWYQKDFSDAEVDEILSTFKIYCLRRRLIQGLTSGETKNFPRFVKFIHILKSAKKKGMALFDLLSKGEYMIRLPNDEELQKELNSTSNFYSFKHCKFYLSLIEESLTKSRPSPTDKLLQIEHIMPQNLSPKWIASLGSEDIKLYPQYVHSIGNLTLIRHNQELGNKPFEEKKQIYADHSGLQIAKTKIVTESNWNINAIKKRAEWIISYLLSEVLPIPDSIRGTNNYKVRQGKKYRLSFKELQLIGETITFIDDPSIKAKVVSDTEVIFEGKKSKLSPLTRELKQRMGKCSLSGAYQGAQHWRYQDIKLAELMTEITR